MEQLVGAVRLRPGLTHAEYVEALAWSHSRVSRAATQAEQAGRLIRTGATTSVRYWPCEHPRPLGVAPEAWVVLEGLRRVAAETEAVAERLEALGRALDGAAVLAIEAWVDAGRPMSDAPSESPKRVLVGGRLLRV